MMPSDPTRRSALSVALLAHIDSGYEVDCWLADNGQPNGSVRSAVLFETLWRTAWWSAM